MNLRLFAVVPVVIATTASAIAVEPVKATERDSRRLVVSLGAQTLTEKLGTLNLGLLLAGSTRTVALEVQNPSPTALLVDAFSFGGSVSAQWADADPETGLTTRALIEPSGSSVLNITILAGQPTMTQFVSLMNLGLELATVAVLWTPTPNVRIPRPVSQKFFSGLGEWWSPFYRVCLGPAPPGYTLERVDFLLSGDTQSRGCGAWAICQAEQSDNNDVCYRFSVQGHHSSVFGDSEDSVVRFTISLTGTYALVAAEPALTAFTEAVAPPD